VSSCSREPPAVESRPVDVQRPGQCVHVDALTGEEGPTGLPERVERSRPASRRAGELALQRRVR